MIGRRRLPMVAKGPKIRRVTRSFPRWRAPLHLFSFASLPISRPDSVDVFHLSDTPTLVTNAPDCSSNLSFLAPFASDLDNVDATRTSFEAHEEGAAFLLSLSLEACVEKKSKNTLTLTSDAFD